MQACVKNFNGELTRPVLRAFSQFDEYDNNNIYSQFGRVGKDDFNMETAFPVSLFQAFAVRFTYLIPSLLANELLPN